MAGREGDVEDVDALARRGFDLPTSGRPIAPPPAPSREATWDLAWRYGRDLARLHFVDPEKLYFFWELTDATAGRGAGRPGSLAARLLRVVGTNETVAHVAPGVFAVMSWYWEAHPAVTYRAELGWLSPDGVFETWLASNAIETPRLSVNVTDHVTWRVRGGSAAGETLPRGAGGPSTASEDDEAAPSTRPHAAASMARLRARPLWSRTPIRRDEGKK